VVDLSTFTPKRMVKSLNAETAKQGSRGSQLFDQNNCTKSLNVKKMFLELMVDHDVLTVSGK
ncbi:hypothetical protein AC249_AIPGENE22420, partial [Exaiptasia diaphana]